MVAERPNPGYFDMRVFSLALLAASAIGAVSIGSAAAMPFSNPASAQESLVQDVRVVCDRFGRCYNTNRKRATTRRARIVTAIAAATVAIAPTAITAGRALASALARSGSASGPGSRGLRRPSTIDGYNAHNWNRKAPTSRGFFSSS